ncbi:MAG: hypothetical protein ABI877_22640, partial [Gemmatimonadaceae bacterium]
PAMGSVLLIDTVIRDTSIPDLRSTMDVAPWCPICVLSDQRLGGRGVKRIPRTCQVSGLDSIDDATNAILRAVDDRPRPTPSTLVEWIVRRTRVHAVGRTLSDLFTRPLLRKVEASYLSYQVRDHLAMLGTWSAVDWQHAAQFAEYAADRTSLNRLLSATDIASLETRQRMQELLGVAEREFHSAHGWEWVLEASLRRSGFFDTHAKDFRRMSGRRSAIPSMTAGKPAYAMPQFGQRRAS